MSPALTTKAHLQRVSRQPPAYSASISSKTPAPPAAKASSSKFQLFSSIYVNSNLIWLAHFDFRGSSSPALSSISPAVRYEWIWLVTANCWKYTSSSSPAHLQRYQMNSNFVQALLQLISSFSPACWYEWIWLVLTANCKHTSSISPAHLQHISSGI